MRNPSVYIIIGKTRIGKSTFLKNFCVAYRKNYAARKIIIVDPHLTFNLESVKYVRVDNEGINEVKLFNLLKLKAQDSLIIFDDAKMYTNDRSQGALDLCRQRGHKGNDLVFVYHTFIEVPPRLWGYATHVIAFSVQEEWNTRLKDRLPPALKMKVDEKYLLKNQRYKWGKRDIFAL